MKKRNLLSYIAIAALVSACGSNFEWFPSSTGDNTAPAVSATISKSTSGGTISATFNNRTTHVSSLSASAPADVTFTADKAATIYYTTNDSSTLNTASPSVAISSSGAAVSVPGLITVTGTILRFFGVSTGNQASSTLSGKIVTP
jgi:hypothetical protein